MNIERIISYDMDENCYLIFGDNKIGALIDPGKDIEKIEKKIGGLSVDVRYILLTHSHYDHTYGVNKIRDGKKLLCSSECNRNIQNKRYNLSEFSGEAFVLKEADIILSDGEEFIIDGIKIKALKTPGHTDGGICYLAEQNLFSGDTLFKRSVGRWDFPTGDREILTKSIKEKLYTLPDETKVFPGHGEETSIGYEKKFNLYITE